MLDAFAIHSAIGSDFMNNLQHSCASRVHSLQATSKYIKKFAETECHFDNFFYYRLHRKATSRAASDENFIKMIFPFQCSCKLNHTNIPFRPCPCIHNMLRPCVCIWNTIHVLYVGLSHLILSMYPYFEFYVSHIYHICKQPSFIIATPTGIWGVKWTLIWHFQISINRNTDFVKSL